MPGLLPGVDSRYRNIIPLPACVIVAELYPVNCIPLEGFDIMLDFKQLTHEPHEVIQQMCMYLCLHLVYFKSSPIDLDSYVIMTCSTLWWTPTFLDQ